MSSFCFKEAIVVNNLSAERLSEVETLNNVNVNKCREEMSSLFTALREAGVDVIELSPEQSPFIGDLAFVINGMGMIANPRGRRKLEEVKTIGTVLRKELDIPIIEIDEPDAYVDGADVLFTGRELFVGISDFTNVNGARCVANNFPEFPCSPIKVPVGKHLTDFVNMASPDVLCVGKSKDAQEIIKRMEWEASYRYQKLTMLEDLAVNVLYVNGCLLHLSEDVIPKSYSLFSEKLSNLCRKPVDLTEFAKFSAPFSRLMILMNKKIRR